MDALSLHSKILDGYKEYIWSFIDIHDEDIRKEVEKSLNSGKLWPDPLIQFNPSFEKTGSVDGLVADGTLNASLGHVFKGVSLYTHQIEAMRLGSQLESFVVTSGTGSGKSLTYLGTVFNHLFREGVGKGFSALNKSKAVIQGSFKSTPVSCSGVMCLNPAYMRHEGKC